MRRLLAGIALLVCATLGTAAAANVGETRDSSKASFEFALIGDVPYRADQEPLLDSVIDEINSRRIAFTIHVGDIKSGSSLCDDAVYFKERDRFETFKRALVYTPGDNEWTDCHRESAGGYDPLERLDFLRTVMFSDPATSFGRNELSLEYQSAEYPENARWHSDRVTFATLHIVGSNNNLGRTPENDAEYAARNEANLAWLAETFDAAESKGSAGIVLAIQANVFDENVADPSGFDDFVAALRAETIEYGKPVVLVHGDSHYFRIDKPLVNDDGEAIANFTRVEVFGDLNVHWVRGTVDLRDTEVFTFDQEILGQ